MSKPAIDQIRSNRAPSVTELVAETRIDAPHRSAEDHRATEPVAEAAYHADLASELERIDFEALTEEDQAPVDPALISKNVQLQAGQLAEHLRERQRQLDHREAELNARAAQVESDLRAARLWIAEREAELEETGGVPESVLVYEEAIRRKAEALAGREQSLMQAESDVESQQAALQKLHEQLMTDRLALEEASQAQSERIAAEELRLAAEIDQQRREIQERAEQVDITQAALEQFRGELGRMHRETLEIRLATEELWAELSGSAPSAALTRSLGRIRSRLADHYRLANQELQQKKDELEKLRAQLSEQYEKLVRQKRNFDNWTAECRDEVERQSARLLARGQELDRHEASLSEYSRNWQAERIELQQEIRRLRNKLNAQAGVELGA